MAKEQLSTAEDCCRPQKRRLGFVGNLVARAAILVPAAFYVACGSDGSSNEGYSSQSFSAYNPNATRPYEPTPSPSPTPESTLELTPSPTPEPTPEPNPQSTPQPTFEPPQVDLSVCQQEDTQKEGALYVAPNIGVKKRIFPSLDAGFRGGASLNTELTIECERDINGEIWFRVNSAQGEFWVPQIYVSSEPLPVAISPAWGGGDQRLIRAVAIK